jgi:hypothetical protein
MDGSVAGRLAAGALAAAAGLLALADSALAHAGSLSGALEPAPVPFWLVVATGGGVVGVSFLVTSLLTDHETIRSLNEGRVGLPLPVSAETALAATRAFGVAGLAAVVGVALFGPPEPLRNLGLLVVWVGWWAGYTVSTYLLAPTWAALNPWRTLASLVPVDPVPLPDGVAGWPAVAGLLLLVYVEVVTPVASNPRLLGVVVLAYTAVTVAGGVRHGDAWFERADPLSRVFDLYGRLAPVRRGPDGLSVSFPGAALARDPGAMRTADVAFVVALLWVTTYDGLVSTAPWNDVVRALAGAGVAPLATQFATLVVGFGVLLGAYRLAARYGRRTADTYVTADFVARWFAPALLPIAAGYHLAHFLGYFLGLAPALAVVATDPLSPPVGLPTLVLPPWYGSVQLALVVLGHVLAVWVAHARSFDLFAGRLQPVRSQYPFVVVMVAYTATSLWIVSQPYAAPVT